MKNLITALFVLLISNNLVKAQDQPTRCENAVTPFDVNMKGKITSQVRSAHQYYMYSKDPAAGDTYAERTLNLQKEIVKTFQAFMKARREEYRKTVCYYYKVDWNKPGNSSNRTLTVQPGFYLLTGTLKRTLNGDWKGGPVWSPNEINPTSITWRTGGHKKSNTFVDIQAVYDQNYVDNTIINELNQARKELNDLGIPTELPPFLEV
ncbi:hypothetical protein D0809_10355 [Flavobacterium circumlabens]|uniref:GLPGLI family protein n=1 Tax=Flavobacterium circumlabens TaxID=2133765 RepID=A0A4Y7UDX1_9FLAO|nr:hypothetical protein [Flavobacterium circumlabens]TCN58742.1 hypothetical protein EV142_103182 [Flavobacterium circumlabens]TEB44158.1 hypothetical protein D0809_10355 [Flavobacterium circumlabens]